MERYYYFSYHTENNGEIQIKTDSKKTREEIAKFIKSSYKPINNEGYWWEEDEPTTEEIEDLLKIVNERQTNKER